jgi:pimeloyl-ACP methyl ester carboxylesterase
MDMNLGRKSEPHLAPFVRLRQHVLPIDDPPIRVTEGGPSHGPTAVFLHARPPCRVVFEEIVARLSRRSHVLAVDLPSLDRRGKPPQGRDQLAGARIVRDVIRELATGDVTLVGHEIGGQIALEFLHAFPCELARAVLIDVVAHNDSQHPGPARPAGGSPARATPGPIPTPVLCLRDAPAEVLARDVRGLRATGLAHVVGRAIGVPDGHHPEAPADADRACALEARQTAIAAALQGFFAA